MPEHRAVAFREDIAIDVDDPVGTDAEDVLVIGGVMDLAERQAVRCDGVTTSALTFDRSQELAQPGPGRELVAGLPSSATASTRTWRPPSGSRRTSRTRNPGNANNNDVRSDMARGLF